jgi:hypothetical protein
VNVLLSQWLFFVNEFRRLRQLFAVEASSQRLPSLSTIQSLTTSEWQDYTFCPVETQEQIGDIQPIRYALFELPTGDYMVRVTVPGYDREYYGNVNLSHEAKLVHNQAII